MSTETPSPIVPYYKSELFKIGVALLIVFLFISSLHDSIMDLLHYLGVLPNYRAIWGYYSDNPHPTDITATEYMLHESQQEFIVAMICGAFSIALLLVSLFFSVRACSAGGGIPSNRIQISPVLIFGYMGLYQVTFASNILKACPRSLSFNSNSCLWNMPEEFQSWQKLGGRPDWSYQFLFIIAIGLVIDLYMSRKAKVKNKRIVA